MFSVIKDIYLLISFADKIKFKMLVVLVFFTTIFEIVGLALLLPFLALIANLDLIDKNKYINFVYLYLNLNNHQDFLHFVGFFAIFFIFIGTILAIYTNLQLLNFSTKIANDFSSNVLKYSLLTYSTEKLKQLGSEFNKKIFSDCIIVGNGIIYPSINIISKTFLIFLLFFVLMIVNVEITVLLLCIFILFYFIYFIYSKKKTFNNNIEIKKLKESKTKILKDALDDFTINDLTINELTNYYKEQSYSLSRMQSVNIIIGKLPRYIMSFIVFSFVVLITMYLENLKDFDIHVIFSKILIYLVVGLKMLPQAQNVFVNYLKLKSSLHVFYNIKDELKKFNDIQDKK